MFIGNLYLYALSILRSTTVDSVEETVTVNEITYGVTLQTLGKFWAQQPFCLPVLHRRHFDVMSLFSNRGKEYRHCLPLHLCWWRYYLSKRFRTYLELRHCKKYIVVLFITHFSEKPRTSCSVFLFFYLLGLKKRKKEKERKKEKKDRIVVIFWRRKYAIIRTGVVLEM